MRPTTVIASSDTDEYLAKLAQAATGFLKGEEQRDCPVCAHYAQALGLHETHYVQTRHRRLNGTGFTAWRHETRSEGVFHSIAVRHAKLGALTDSRGGA